MAHPPRLLFFNLYPPLLKGGGLRKFPLYKQRHEDKPFYKGECPTPSFTDHWPLITITNLLDIVCLSGYRTFVRSSREFWLRRSG